MTTETEKEVDPKRRVKRLRADHNFHPTISLLNKAMKFRASGHSRPRQNDRKVMEDEDARMMAQELVRHAKHWYVNWNEYRTNLKMPPDEEETRGGRQDQERRGGTGGQGTGLGNPTGREQQTAGQETPAGGPETEVRRQGKPRA